MTNKERFISTFGNEAYNMIIAKADKDLLLWFLEDYKDTKSYPLPIAKTDCTREENIRSSISHTSIQKTPSYETGYGRRNPGSGRRKGVCYQDLEWYEDIVTDLYVGKEKCKSVKLVEDKSPLKTPTCLDTLQTRFKKAVKNLKLEDEIRVSKFYKGTVNECVMLDVISRKRDANSTYAYL